jgi:hypothetical protein
MIRSALAALAVFLFSAPLRVDAFQSMHAQRAITLVINATQIAFLDLPPGRGIGMGTIVSAPSPASPVTIAANQGSAKVNANVIADPNATLLVLNKTLYSMTQTAGSTVLYSCAFTFQVGVSSTTSWTLDDGLASDFGGGLSASAVAFTAYPTPGSPPASPIWTNFINYYTNNNNWQVTAHATGPITECVDLKVTLPSSLPAGQYSATAVYSLYY